MIGQWRTSINEKKYAMAATKRRLADTVKKHAEAEDVLQATREAQVFLQNIAQEVQNRIHERVAGTVCQALSGVFDTPYTFDLRFVEKRGKTEAEMAFIRNGVEIDPLSASGGGVVDVAAFALRLAAIMISAHKERRRVLILDEPFKFVSARYREHVRDLLEKVSTVLNMQIIFVTHVQDYETGKTITITK